MSEQSVAILALAVWFLAGLVWGFNIGLIVLR